MINRFNHSQRPDLVKIEQVKVCVLFFAFPPESYENEAVLAGLLACSAFYSLPIGQLPNSGRGVKGLFVSLQLRGQPRIFTGFPFKPKGHQ